MTTESAKRSRQRVASIQMTALAFKKEPRGAPGSPRPNRVGSQFKRKCLFRMAMWRLSRHEVDSRGRELTRPTHAFHNHAPHSGVVPIWGARRVKLTRWRSWAIVDLATRLTNWRGRRSKAWRLAEAAAKAARRFEWPTGTRTVDRAIAISKAMYRCPLRATIHFERTRQACREPQPRHE